MNHLATPLQDGVPSVVSMMERRGIKWMLKARGHFLFVFIPQRSSPKEVPFAVRLSPQRPVFFNTSSTPGVALAPRVGVNFDP
jgi:hypothetical protein